MNKVQKKQIIEWLDNPVTLAFKAASEQERDKVIDDGGLNSYFANDAHRTQEALAELTGKGHVWEEILATLEGEGLWELEDEE